MFGINNKHNDIFDTIISLANNVNCVLVCKKWTSQIMKNS